MLLADRLLRSIADVSVVLVIGRFLRMSVNDVSHRIVFEEMPQVRSGRLGSSGKPPHHIAVTRHFDLTSPNAAIVSFLGTHFA